VRTVTLYRPVGPKELELIQGQVGVGTRKATQGYIGVRSFEFEPFSRSL
jgi:hypothetical protein